MGTTRRLVLKHKELTKKVNNKTKHKRQCQELTLRLYWRPDAISVTSRESGTPLWLLTSSWSATAFDEAAEAMKQIAKSGKKILFVATKKQAKQCVADLATSVGMPYVIERWPGGMLTNFPTIRKAVKKMSNIDKLIADGTFSNLSKREILQVSRQRAKLEKNLGSIADLNRLPSALFVVDVLKEQIAVREANRLGIPVFGIVDTNSSPDNIDFVIPANDDASKSIEVILQACCAAINEGLEERKAEKADEDAAAAQDDQPVKKGRRSGKAREEEEEAPEAE